LADEFILYSNVTKSRNIEGLIFTHLYLEIVQEQQGTVDTVAEKYVCFGGIMRVPAT
jgi:hypothetical protein